MARIVGLDERRMKKATCKKCNCINEYHDGEVRNLWSGTDYGGGPDGANGFTCANCGENVITERW